MTRVEHSIKCQACNPCHKVCAGFAAYLHDPHCSLMISSSHRLLTLCLLQPDTDRVGAKCKRLISILLPQDEEEQMCMECALRANVMGKEDGFGQKENIGVLFCHPKLDKYEQLAQWLEQHPLLHDAGVRRVFLPRVDCIAYALRCACKCTCMVCYLGAVFGTLCHNTAGASCTVNEEWVAGADWEGSRMGRGLTEDALHSNGWGHHSSRIVPPPNQPFEWERLPSAEPASDSEEEEGHAAVNGMLTSERALFLSLVAGPDIHRAEYLFSTDGQVAYRRQRQRLLCLLEMMHSQCT